MDNNICEECGLPIKVCNRIATLEHQVQTLAKAVKQLAKEAARTWDYDGEQMVAEGVVLERAPEIDDIICRR